MLVPPPARDSSPTAELRLRVAKMAAGMALPVAITGQICGAIAVLGRPGLAVLALMCSVACAAGCCCSWLQVARITPTPRRDVLQPRRRSADQSGGMDFGRGLIGGTIMLVGAAGLGLAASSHWRFGAVLLGIMALAIIACFTLVNMEKINERTFPSAPPAPDHS